MIKDRSGEGLESETTMREASLEVEATDPKLPPEVQEKLGDELRKYYASLVSMPLPERFIELLDRLAKSEDDKSGK